MMKKGILFLLIGLLVWGLSSCSVDTAAEQPNVLGPNQDVTMTVDRILPNVVNNTASVVVFISNNHAEKTLTRVTFRVNREEKSGTMIFPPRKPYTFFGTLEPFPSTGLAPGESGFFGFTLEGSQKSEKDLVKFFNNPTTAVHFANGDATLHASAGELRWTNRS